MHFIEGPRGDNLSTANTEMVEEGVNIAKSCIKHGSVIGAGTSINIEKTKIEKTSGESLLNIQTQSVGNAKKSAESTEKLDTRKRPGQKEFCLCRLCFFETGISSLEDRMYEIEMVRLEEKKKRL